MRRFLISVVLALLVVVSAGIGVIVARWPLVAQLWQTGGPR